MQTFQVQDVQELNKVAQKLLPEILKHKIVLFKGEMGSGKTTLIKSICKQLQISDEASSPTYAIVNEYYGKEQKVFHFDLYRLDSKEELLDIGFEDYLDSESICLIEWPELAEEWIESGIKIEIEKIDLNSRKISIFKI